MSTGETKPMIQSSPWADHTRIAIRVWSLDRARKMAAMGYQASLQGEMENFLAELLSDALQTFNDDYNDAYNQHVAQMERLLNDALAVKPAPTIFFPSERFKDKAGDGN